MGPRPWSSTIESSSRTTSGSGVCHRTGRTTDLGARHDGRRGLPARARLGHADSCRPETWTRRGEASAAGERRDHGLPAAFRQVPSLAGDRRQQGLSPVDLSGRGHDVRPADPGRRQDFFGCYEGDDVTNRPLLWPQQEEEGPLGVSHPGEIDAGSAYRDGSIFFGSSGGRFYRVDAETGKEIWSYQIPDAHGTDAANLLHALVHGRRGLLQLVRRPSLLLEDRDRRTEMAIPARGPARRSTCRWRPMASVSSWVSGEIRKPRKARMPSWSSARTKTPAENQPARSTETQSAEKLAPPSRRLECRDESIMPCTCGPKRPRRSNLATPGRLHHYAPIRMPAPTLIAGRSSAYCVLDSRHKTEPRIEGSLTLSSQSPDGGNGIGARARAFGPTPTEAVCVRPTHPRMPRRGCRKEPTSTSPKLAHVRRPRTTVVNLA